MGRLRERESHCVVPLCSLSDFYGVFLPSFLWPIFLICLVHSPYLVYLGILTSVHTHLLAKMESITKAYGWNITWRNSPLTSKEHFLCMCGWRGFLTSRTRNMWSVQGPPSSFNCPAILVLEFQSIENESPTAVPWRGGACLPPASEGVVMGWARGRGDLDDSKAPDHRDWVTEDPFQKGSGKPHWI